MNNKLQWTWSIGNTRMKRSFKKTHIKNVNEKYCEKKNQKGRK